MVSGRESEQGIFDGHTQAALHQRRIASDLPGTRFHHKYIKPGGVPIYIRVELTADVIKEERLEYDGFIEDGTVAGITANRTELIHYDVKPKGESWIFVKKMNGLPVYRTKELKKQGWR